MGQLWNWFQVGGFIMYPLALCSLAVWVVLIERFMRFKKVSRELDQFQLEAVNALLRDDQAALKSTSQKHFDLPTSRCVSAAYERLQSNDLEVRKTWRASFERTRQVANADLKSYLWVLGTIGASAPFIGLFGTIVGILKTFGEMARAGAGGFAVVAGGISEALIATAAGLIVAIISVLAYNAFQVQFQRLSLRVRLSCEELAELIEKKAGV